MQLMQNERGLTLLEVVASIVLLSIILVSILNFLPLMGKTNIQNENKQLAMNIAYQEFLYWRGKLENDENFEKFLRNPLQNASYDFIDDPDSVFCNNGSTCTANTVHETVSFTTPSQDLKFSTKLTFKVNSDLNNGETKAFETTVTLFNDKNENISETYGYIFPKK